VNIFNSRFQVLFSFRGISTGNRTDEVYLNYLNDIPFGLRIVKKWTGECRPEFFLDPNRAFFYYFVFYYNEFIFLSFVFKSKDEIR